MQRSKSLAMMFLLGTLVVGGALGFSAGRMFIHDPRCAPPNDSTIGSWRDRFAADLRLTPAQRVAVDSILDRRHHDFAAIQATVRPRMDSVRQKARSDIGKLLTPDQQQRFQQLIREANAHQAREETTKK
ncbi:MAG TPA: hypothetical protein VFJ96_11025 [Gemmatimonadaceae bacterium]|jgi:hypothetical protein|nr:hypothetical protein [Gemmatimonadaceae bacterium]